MLVGRARRLSNGKGGTLHADTVGRCLKRLETKGLIKRGHRYSREKRGRTSDRITLLNYDPHADYTTQLASDKSRGVLPDDPADLPDDSDVLPDAALRGDRTVSKEPSDKDRQSEDEGSFSTPSPTQRAGKTGGEGSEPTGDRFGFDHLDSLPGGTEFRRRIELRRAVREQAGAARR